MAHHLIPNLFVSRRRDRSPNGFNCAVCQKDISFLSRGEIEIWRHAICKSHYLRDRRYRYDHEDVIYTQTFDLIPVSEITPELRAEIEETPPVTLGKKNPFVEDEIDSLVGVPSNIPPSTLVGCLFELLRSGGSQGLLRRLWMQFRTTLPVDSVYAQSTWSKTETFVVLTQTLYPRVLRRVKSWAKDYPFAISFKCDFEKIICMLHFCVDGQLKHVVVLWEPQSVDLCGAELRCLSRIYSILPTGVCPVAVRGCSATLLHSLVEWSRSKELSLPLTCVDFTDVTLVSCLREVSQTTGLPDPISIVDFLVEHLGRSVHQPWLLEMPVLRRCLLEKGVSFRHLTEVIPEIVAHWSDIKLFLSSLPDRASSWGTSLLPSSLDACLPSLCYLHIVLLCYRANVPSQFSSEIQDRSLRNYSEFCFFYWSLLAKVKRLADLPNIDSWSSYIGKPLTSWSNLHAVDCLRSESIIVSASQGLSDVALRGFLKDCHGLVMELLKILNTCSYVSSCLSSSLSCLSADMLVVGDETYTVELFQQLVGCLRDVNLVSEVQGEAAINEFRSFIVDVRRRNQRPVNSIKDSIAFMRSFGFFGCRENLSYVINRLAVLLDPGSFDFPVVDISYSGILLPEKILQSSVLSVQSMVMTPSFSSGDLLTKTCLEELKVNLPNGKQFLEAASFRPWDDVYERSRAEVYQDLEECFRSYFQGQLGEWRAKISAMSAFSKPSTPGRRSSSTPRRGSSLGVSSSSTGPGVSPIASSKTVLPSVSNVLPPIVTKMPDVIRAKRLERAQESSTACGSSGVGVAGSKSSEKKGRGAKPRGK